MSVRVKRLKLFHFFFFWGGDLTEKKRQKAQFVAHVRHAQASEAGIEILELSTQLSQCVLQGLSECFGKTSFNGVVQSDPFEPRRCVAFAACQCGSRGTSIPLGRGTNSAAAGSLA